MRDADLDAVMAIDAVSFPNPWSKVTYRGELGSPLSKYLVLELEDRIVGYVGVKHVADEVHIMSLAIHPEHRLQGHARTLLTAALNECSGAGYAYLEVRKSNEPALRLYESLGFAPAGVRRSYYRGEDAILMSLKL